MVESRPIRPMTIAGARKMELLGVELACRACGRSGFKSFDDLVLAEETPIPAIARARRFVCSACGSLSVVSLPDWSNYHAPGMGSF
jgi:hypothetical protein